MRCREDPMRVAIHDRVQKIITKDFSAVSPLLSPVEIENMNVIKTSWQEYYRNELETQNELFDKFFTAQKKAKTQMDLGESLETHSKVVAFLRNATDTASPKMNIYKVHYLFKAKSRTANYNQQATMFLDSNLNRIESNYSFLKEHSR
jgi:hypothetical protein